MAISMSLVRLVEDPEKRGKRGSGIQCRTGVVIVPGSGDSYVSQIVTILLPLAAASSSISFLFRLGFLA